MVHLVYILLISLFKVYWLAKYKKLVLRWERRLSIRLLYDWYLWNMEVRIWWILLKCDNIFNKFNFMLLICIFYAKIKFYS